MKKVLIFIFLSLALGSGLYFYKTKNFVQKEGGRSPSSMSEAFYEENLDPRLLDPINIPEEELERVFKTYISSSGMSLPKGQGIALSKLIFKKASPETPALISHKAPPKKRNRGLAALPAIAMWFVYLGASTIVFESLASIANNIANNLEDIGSTCLLVNTAREMELEHAREQRALDVLQISKDLGLNLSEEILTQLSQDIDPDKATGYETAMLYQISQGQVPLNAETYKWNLSICSLGKDGIGKTHKANPRGQLYQVKINASNKKASEDVKKLLDELEKRRVKRNYGIDCKSPRYNCTF